MTCSRYGPPLAALACLLTTQISAEDRLTQTSAAQLASEAQVLALEQSLWEAEKSGNIDAVADRLADDFMQIGSDGPMDRAAALKAMRAARVASYSLTNVKVIKASNDVAIVTLEYAMTIEGQAETHGYASSTWANRGGRWLNLLYVSVAKSK